MKITSKFAGVVVFMVAFQMSAFGSPQEKNDKKEREHYSAVAVGTGGMVGGRTLSLDIYINEYSTDEEVRELAGVLKNEGQKALRSRLEKISKGRISPVGRVGNDVAVIRSRPTENGRRIFLISARVMPWLELYIGGRTTDYNLSWMILDVNEEGKGEGAVIPAAELKFREDGTLEVESYGHQNIKLSNVRLWK